MMRRDTASVVVVPVALLLLAAFQPVECIGSRWLLQSSPAYGSYPPPSYPPPPPSPPSPSPPPPDPPLPPEGTPSTGYVEISSTISVTPAACTAAQQNEAPFTQAIKEQTAAAWNLTPMGEASPIAAEDVLDVVNTFSCGSRRSLSQESASISTSYTVSWRLAPGALAADVTANAADLQDQITTAYTSTSDGGSVLFPAAAYGAEISNGAVTGVVVAEIPEPTVGGLAIPPSPPPSYPPPSYPPPTYSPPPPISVPDLDNAQRSESILAVPIAVTLTLGDNSCTRASNADKDLFTYLYRVATANGWNSSTAGAVAGQGVFAADITGSSMTFGCVSGSGASNITIAGTLTNVPLSVTADIANGNKDSYQTELVSYYTTGAASSSRRRRHLLSTDLSTEFDVTGATVAVSNAISTADDGNNNLALGLGLGLGLGIPFLACVVIAIVMISRRRKAQAIGPADGGDGEAGDTEEQQ